MKSAWLPLAVFLLAVPLPAAAQVSIAGYNVYADEQEVVDENLFILRGRAELERTSDGARLHADEVRFFRKEDRAVAVGNVVFSQGKNTIAADRAELNTVTRTGTFHNATGSAIAPTPRASGPIVAPQLAGQETNVFFFGEVIEKIGPKKYRITNGGFTTCVQPTPRWDLTADSVVLNIDDYTFLRQAILKVKGVPLLYLPVLWYPTKEEGRATGFLLPTYGSSTIRGQAIHNAFFWAINRSHDATIMHDWFSKTGIGLGGEYRYNLTQGDGQLRTYLLDQRATTYELPGGGINPSPASRSYEIRGSASHVLSPSLRARARADYFSSLTTMQTFNTNFYDASRNTRTIGANLVGSWRTYSLNATFDRNESFSGADSSFVTGNTPRVSFTRNERPLFDGSPAYFALGTEMVQLTSRSHLNGVTNDRGLSRFDVSPRLRYPFKRWQWFTVNSSLTLRDTFYTRSLSGNTIVSDSINRTVLTMQADAVGPVFNRVWDTPDNEYAEKFKHSIEPFLNVQRTTSVEEFSRIVQTDGVDSLLGNTGLTYGLRNRFYAKRRQGRLSQAQEIVTVEMTQTYNTDERATAFNRDYTTTYGAPAHFAPILLSARATPWPEVSAAVRAEVDSKYLELRTMSVNGSYNWRSRWMTTVGWSQRYFIEELAYFNDRNYLDHYLNVSTDLRTSNNQFGGSYMFNYDVLRSTMSQQRVTGFYNAQCCGIALEYQRYNFRGGFAPIPSDHRFFLSFTLAGLGNFSPFNGAMSGVPR